MGSLVLLPVGQALSGPVAAAAGISTTLFGAAAITMVLFAAALAAPRCGTSARRQPSRRLNNRWAILSGGR